MQAENKPGDTGISGNTSGPHNARPGAKVLMALSGGVDSAACVRLLQQSGYNVAGLVIRFSPAHEKAVKAATAAAAELGIPLHVADAEALFTRQVIAPFCADYAAGLTPNPCVVCNPTVKFRILAQEADRLGISLLASGHYARIMRKGAFYHLACAQSAARDQSYMLYRLPQSILARLLLPAGEMEKAQIRSIAAGSGLSSAETPDSQEICFIPDGDYAAYIQSRGVPALPGRFIGPGGEDLGPHRGVLHYTPGQRRGLGVALGKPVFVKAILPTGSIQLAFAQGLAAHGVQLRGMLSTAGPPLPDGDYAVKIRSMAQPVPCRLAGSSLVFATTQRAPAPGQHAVLYTGGIVMGGGVIDAVDY